MLELFFFPIRICVELALLPVRLFTSLLRSGWLLTAWVMMGLISLVAGLVRGLLPLILVGVGLTMIAGAYQSAKRRKEGVRTAEESESFQSYYASGRVE